MGPMISKLTQALNNNHVNNPRILLLGLDGAGKTTILYKLKLNENVPTVPTNGFNVEDLKTRKNVTFTMWDVGRSHTKSRQLARHYYPGSEGLIFVVDASDVTRIREARDDLFSIVSDEGTEKGVPIVVLANKQDVPNALKSSELIDKMGLRDLKGNPWYVKEVCATSGEGLDEGINIMADMVETFQMGKAR